MANNRAQERIRKIQQDTQTEMTEIDTELKKIIDTIRDDQGIGKKLAINDFNQPSSKPQK